MLRFHQTAEAARKHYGVALRITQSGATDVWGPYAIVEQGRPLRECVFETQGYRRSLVIRKLHEGVLFFETRNDAVILDSAFLAPRFGACWVKLKQVLATYKADDTFRLWSVTEG